MAQFTPPVPDVDALLAAALRGDGPPWPGEAGSGADEDAVLVAADSHGVEALLRRALRPTARTDWPDRVVETLRTRARLHAVTETLQRAEIERALQALHAKGVRPLVLKGAALAYSHYPDAWLRPRVDTDLLIRPNDRAATERVMVDLGYRARRQATGQLVSYQRLWERRDRLQVRHLFDLHTKIANPQLFADALTYDELSARAAPLPLLGPTARGPAAVDALLLACVHRVAHHYDGDRLIWLYDIHLLATAMTSEDLQDVVGRADAKRLRAVCAAGLNVAQARFHTPVPAAVTEALTAVRRGRAEPSAAFLRKNLTQIQVLASDLRRLPWRGRCRLMREHLFPPLASMRQVYRRWPPALLPFAYAHRIVAGAAGWFSPR